MRLAVCSSLITLLTALTGCAGTTPPPGRAAGPAAPSAQGEVAPAPANPSRADGSPEAKAERLGELPEGVPAAAASCPSAGALPRPAPCPAALESLAEALRAPAGDQDALLQPLESCSEFPPGAVRALRAEALPDCADAFVMPVVGPSAAEDQGESPGLRSVLVALGLGAQLRRTVLAAPAIPRTSSRGQLEAYFAQELFPWATTQSKAVHVLASQGSRLSGYARGLVAIEAAMADMRFVEMARGVPLPDDMQGDPEVADVYYASLDEALEPRKDRARDAALIGLAEFSRLGITASDRLVAARQLISRIFAGHRMTALDRLLVPAPSPCEATTPLASIAAAVATPYAAVLVAPRDPSPAEVRCLLTRGMPTFLQRSLAAKSDAESAYLLGQGEFELGRTYFMAEHFQRAEAALSRALDSEGPDGSLGALDRTSAQVLRALAVGLMAGPQSPVDLFRQGALFPRPLGDLTLLDAQAASSTGAAALAGFDAAYLRELVPPQGSAQFWLDLAERYERVVPHLPPEARTEARTRAKAARDTAATLKRQLR